jgi:transcriptional regulator with XRE-family HTH domain
VGDLPENGDPLATFGRWLARERELRGLARDEVTRAVKLAPGVVDALESGDEARMPPRAYAVGYLRAYAAAVGLDANEVLLRFEETFRPAPPARRRSPAISGRIAAAVVVSAALAGAVVWVLVRG